MKPHQQSQKNIGGDIMTDVEEIKDKMIRCKYCYRSGHIDTNCNTKVQIMWGRNVKFYN